MKIIGVGVDIVSNVRFRQILNKDYSLRFLTRVLNKQHEIAQFQMKKDEQKCIYLASRWALKQAVVKATGCKQLVFSKMFLTKSISGRPSLQWIQQNIELMKNNNISQVHVSLSHEDQYSIAYAIALSY